jgi:glyoxylase I family protein
VKPLHHIALGARDVEGVAKFYERAFELPRLATHLHDDGSLRSIWLGLEGGAVLMVERTSDPPRRVDGVGAGPFLLAFSVSAEERERRDAELAARGVAIDARTEFTSYLRDPEGNRVAYSCRTMP